MASNSCPGVTIKTVIKNSITSKSVTILYVINQNLLQLCGAIDASSKQSGCTGEHQKLARCGEDGIGQVGEGALAEPHLFLLILLLLLLSVDKEGAECVPPSGDATTVEGEEGRKKCGLQGGEYFSLTEITVIWIVKGRESSNSKLPDRNRRQVFPLRTRGRRSGAQAGRWSRQWRTP